MELLKQIKADRWYGMLLYIGILSCGAPFFKTIEFINPKHLFGLGLGLLTISIANFIALRYVQEFIPGALMQRQEVIHTPFTKTLQFFGIIFLILFLFLLVKDLI